MAYLGTFFILTFTLLARGVFSIVSQHAFSVSNGDSFGIPGNETYDYVVVGGGTAGLAVAMRLAESGDYSVAIIEAGGFYQFESGNRSTVPLNNPDYAAVNEPHLNPLVDWGFVTTSQPALNNRTLHYARGKTLGGSSALNANIYNRGTTATYQRWADIVGDESYQLENWLPYFTRGINFTEANTALRAANASVTPTAENSNAFSNATGGPLQVTYSNFALPFSSWAQKAFQAFGFANTPSFSDGWLLGSQYAPSVLDATTNQRETSQTAYLNAALNSGRTNLKVYTHTLAMQVIFAANKSATAVAVRSGQLDYVLEARKEIILSAGAFQSPQLLMVSGIGPATTLTQNNISVVADLPGVGQDMWDHWDIEVTYKVEVLSRNSLVDPKVAAAQKASYYADPPNSIYGTYGADYIGWEKLPSPYREKLSQQARDRLDTFPSDWPEIEYEIGSVVLSETAGDTDGYGTFVVVPVSPLSRGNLTIQSSSMLDPPVINPAWLSDPTDMELAVQAVQRARSIIGSDAIKPILIGNEFAPGESITTDEQVANYIKNTGFMNWHAACTCRMGMQNDTMAVVDSKGRVFGVSNLRVVDASSFALLPPGHPVSTVYGLAEKISNDIIMDRTS